MDEALVSTLGLEPREEEMTERAWLKTEERDSVLVWRLCMAAMSGGARAQDQSSAPVMSMAHWWYMEIFGELALERFAT